MMPSAPTERNRRDEGRASPAQPVNIIGVVQSDGGATAGRQPGGAVTQLSSDYVNLAGCGGQVPHFTGGSGVGYGPCGAVGHRRVESAPWREGMRVAEEPKCGASGRGAD